MDHFQIDVDNPLCILTQDAARIFLANSSPNEKYKMFLRGTKMEQLCIEYAKFTDLTDTMETTVDEKTRILPEVEQELKDLESQWAKLEEERHLEGSINDLNAQIVWGNIELKEKENGSWRQKWETSKEKVDGATEMTDVLNQRLIQRIERESKGEILEAERLAECAKEIENGLAPLLIKIEASKVEGAALKQKLSDLSAVALHGKEDIERDQMHARTVKSRIDAETLKLQTDQRGVRIQQQERIKEFEEKLVNIRNDQSNVNLF